MIKGKYRRRDLFDFPHFLALLFLLGDRLQPLPDYTDVFSQSHPALFFFFFLSPRLSASRGLGAEL